MRVTSSNIYTEKNREEILEEIKSDFFNRFDIEDNDPKEAIKILEDELINAHLNRTYMRKDFMDAIVYAITSMQALERLEAFGRML